MLLVVDIGTSRARMGLAGSSTPELVVPSFITVWESRLVDVEHFDLLVSNALAGFANKCTEVLVVESVLEHDSLQFRRRVSSTLLERHAQLLAVSFEYAPVLALYSRGITTGGQVLDLGAGSVRLSTVNSGNQLVSTQSWTELGGNALDAPTALPFPHGLGELAHRQRLRESSGEVPAFVRQLDSLGLSPSLVCGGLARTPGVADIFPAPAAVVVACDLCPWLGASLLAASTRLLPNRVDRKTG